MKDLEKSGSQRFPTSAFMLTARLYLEGTPFYNVKDVRCTLVQLIQSCYKGVCQGK